MFEKAVKCISEVAITRAKLQFVDYVFHLHWTVAAMSTPNIFSVLGQELATVPWKINECHSRAVGCLRIASAVRSSFDERHRKCHCHSVQPLLAAPLRLLLPGVVGPVV